MTPDQLRRSIRAELHAARCADGDHSELRLWMDARQLDERMAAAGFAPKHPTTWGTSPAKLAYDASRRAGRCPSNAAGGSEPAEAPYDHPAHARGRARLCRTGSYFGIRPLKLANGHLAWPAVQVTK
jgi:hypothetical protein